MGTLKPLLSLLDGTKTICLWVVFVFVFVFLSSSLFVFFFLSFFCLFSFVFCLFIFVFCLFGSLALWLFGFVSDSLPMSYVMDSFLLHSHAPLTSKVIWKIAWQTVYNPTLQIQCNGRWVDDQHLPTLTACDVFSMILKTIQEQISGVCTHRAVQSKQKQKQQKF